MLLLNRKGEQIVSIALPIRRFSDVQGVLLLSTRPGQIDKILREERIVILRARRRSRCWPRSSRRCCWRAPSPVRCAACRPPPSASATTSTRARSCRNIAGRTDEVAQMATAFHAMTSALCRRIEASEKFAADVAHELKNPLTAARSTAESLGYAKTEEERTHLVAQIQGELKRLNRLITDVSNASRLDAELARKEMRTIDVTAMLRNVVGIFRDIIGDDSRALMLALGSEPFPGAFCVKGDEGRLGQVLTNLIDNAISFSPEGGTVTVQRAPPRRSSRSSSRTRARASPRTAWRSSSTASIRTVRRPTRAAARTPASASASRARSCWRMPARSSPRTATRTAPEPGAKPCGARFTVRLPIDGPAQRGGAPGGRRA